MTKYRIPVFWSVGAIVEIEAKSLEEALDEACKDDDPRRAKDSCFIEGSYVVNIEEAIFTNGDVDEQT